ncbi:hypothetical protein ACTFIZ_009510 [Dictyostelium cf. discoideum]
MSKIFKKKKKNDILVKLLKSIVKSNNFNYLEILYNFINNISKIKKFDNLLKKLKLKILCGIKKYNRISCFKFLLKLDQDNESFFSEDLLIKFYKHINTNSSINKQISDILKINFNINIKDQIKEEEEEKEEYDDGEYKEDDDDDDDYEDED